MLPVFTSAVFSFSRGRMVREVWALGALALLLLGSISTLPASAQQAEPASTPLQSPAAFLGYELGEAFTPYHRVVDYVRHVAEASPRVVLQSYGESIEGRPLLLATVTSAGNHDRIDAIRQNNLRRTGMAPGRVDGTPTAIVWLSYNVHGNESVSTEAAMRTLHALADPTNERTGGWLDDAVVLLDPCLNPDGRERYVQWYRRTVGASAHPSLIAREHDEPWPGGRTNHYYFDLNRDWAWGVQPETRQRLAVYHEWMPHVHVDFHEQGINDPYYFAPAAEPFHENITDWQRSFQFTIGRNHARYFDRNGWLYFTREVFDLFYPGYGDTWPLFNGAIGMTYEQAGSGRAGRAVITATGDTLTLADRIAHHHSTGLSTVEVAAANHETLQEEFSRYYQTARQNPPGASTGYLVRRDASGDRLRALAEHLDRQQIAYGIVDAEGDVRGVAYDNGEEVRIDAAPGDLVVPAAQPKARLAKVLMEPRPTIIDSLTYDVTAWALPFAYGLDAVAVESDLPVTRSGPPRASAAPITGPGGDAPYAYLARWSSRRDAQFLGALLDAGIGVRVATEPFALPDTSFAAGTLVVPRIDNDGRRDFDRAVRRLATEHGRSLYTAATGFTDGGPDLGSSSVRPVPAPTVAVLAGDPLSAYRVGEAWHAFDHQLRYPATLVNADALDAAMLDEVDVLVLPDAGAGWATKERRTLLAEWTRAGGRLIAMGAAVGDLAGHAPFAVRTKGAPADTSEALRPYGDRQRDALVDATPGSIHRARVDATHPLGFGVGDAYFALKRSDDAYAYFEDGEGWNVATLPTGDPVSGFMGTRAQKALAETLVFGEQSLGRGSVVYFTGNPLFRGFWYGGTIPFANAVFFGGE